MINSEMKLFFLLKLDKKSYNKSISINSSSLYLYKGRQKKQINIVIHNNITKVSLHRIKYTF